MRPSRTGAALVEAAQALRDTLRPLFARPPETGATHVLNPIDYGWENYKAYLERARPKIDALLIGMNPGPWGMGQTGVPFGDPSHVRTFLKITHAVARPANEHARCPVRGVDSPRAEVSGQRVWGSVERCFGTPEAFFKRFFVFGFCPLLFLNERGANVTPDKLPAVWMRPILAACEVHVVRAVEILEPKRVVGIGAWATKRIALTLDAAGIDLPRGTILHPSPASPAANRGWLEVARRQLEELGCGWPPPRASG